MQLPMFVVILQINQNLYRLTSCTPIKQKIFSPHFSCYNFQCSSDALVIQTRLSNSSFPRSSQRILPHPSPMSELPNMSFFFSQGLLNSHPISCRRTTPCLLSDIACSTHCIPPFLEAFTSFSKKQTRHATKILYNIELGEVFTRILNRTNLKFVHG